MPRSAALAPHSSTSTQAVLPHPYPEDDGSQCFKLLEKAGQDSGEDNYEAAIESCIAAIASAKQTHSVRYEIAALCMLANGYSSSGLSNEALDVAKIALEKAQGVGDRALEARALFSISLIALDTSDEADALSLLKRSLVCAQDASSPADEFWAHNNLSYIYGEEAKRQSGGAAAQTLEALLEHATHAMAAACQTGEWLQRGFAYVNLSNHAFLTKQNDRARDHIAKYAMLARDHKSLRLLTYANLDEARLLASEGNFETAIELLNSIEHESCVATKGNLLLKTQEALALLYKNYGQFEQAYFHLESARAVERDLHTIKSERQIKLISARIEIQEAHSMAERLRTESKLLEWRNTMLEKEREMLRVNAMLDTLTGLGNRRAAEIAIDRRLEAAIANGDPFQLGYIDIDHFKLVNDQHGHGAGDTVLKLIAEILLSGLRDQDEVFRFGGEEFVLLVAGQNDEDGANVCERLRKLIDDADWSEIDPELHMTASFGVTSWRGDFNPDAILARADSALYEAKHQGRNRVVHG